MKRIILLLPLMLVCHLLQAQNTPNVLFIGNSYTGVNDLPQMISDMASSTGERMTYTSNTPGGCTFQGHCNNNSMSMICQGGWDIVVLQEQSQLPSFPQNQVEQVCFPYAQQLVDSIYAHNPCAEPMFYMTWGRKNGDQQNTPYFPVLGTYEGMDSMLCERYIYMAETNDAALCPVGRVWRYLRTYHPDIELYQSDESHPSIAGTYAAACSFYVMFFHRNPENITFTATLDDATAQTIRTAVRRIVFDSLSRWQRTRPHASFTVSITGSTVYFTSSSTNTDSLTYYFGDGTSITIDSTYVIVSHTYADNNTHRAFLVAYRRCMTDTAWYILNRIDQPTVTIPLTVYPNPTTSRLTVEAPVPHSLELQSLNGYVLKEYRPDQNPYTLNLDGLPAGAYLLQATTPHGTATRIIIKQ